MLKTEDTLYKLDISRHRPVLVFLSVFTAEFSTIQALLFAKHLHRFCCWFEEGRKGGFP